MPSFGQNDRHFLLETVENAARPGIGAGKIGTCVRVTLNVPNIEEVRACGFDRLMLERSIDSQLTWQEVTSPDSRLVLNEGQVDYVIQDAAGSENYYYRTRFIDTQTAEKSDPSEAILGEGLVIQNVLTIPQLKERYFFGIDITDSSGRPLSDATFRHYIIQAVRWFEHQLDIPLVPTTFCELHDFHINDYHAFMIIALDNYPVQQILSARVQYPSGQNVIEFPEEWWRVDAAAGTFQIVPTAGTLSEILVGQGGSFLPVVYNGSGYLPQLFQIQHIAGFGINQVPRNIIDLIGMFASLGPFNTFGDLIAGAGIGTISLSMDGLSQNIGTTASATNAGYGARIKQYLEQIKQQIPLLRKYYKRVGGLVVA